MLNYYITQNKDTLIKQHIYPLDGFYNDILAKAAADMFCTDTDIKEPVVEDALLKHQQMLSDSEGWVFPAKSKTGHRTYMAKQFRRTVERAGLCSTKFTPHAMRHTVITRLIESGIPLEAIRKVSGHKTLVMLLRYAHVSNSFVDKGLSQVQIG